MHDLDPLCLHLQKKQLIMRKQQANQKHMHEVLCPLMEQINVNAEGLLGMQLTCTDSSMWVCLNGMSKDDKNHQGQWKRRRISDTYNDIQLDYINTKVTGVFAPGRVCNYVIVNNGVEDNFLVDVVAPNIADMFGRQVVLVLGKLDSGFHFLKRQLLCQFPCCFAYTVPMGTCLNVSFHRNRTLCNVYWLL